MFTTPRFIQWLISKSYALDSMDVTVECAMRGPRRVINEHIDNRAGLLDDQKHRPKSHVGAQIRLAAATAGGDMKNAVMISSADRLLPTGPGRTQPRLQHTANIH
jgi:hypothetical protein